MQRMAHEEYHEIELRNKRMKGKTDLNPLRSSSRTNLPS